jgi:hypothetical protein
MEKTGNTEGEKYHCTIDLLFDWLGLVCFANKKKFSCHTADSKPVKQEVNGTVILSPFSIPLEKNNPYHIWVGRKSTSLTSVFSLQTSIFCCLMVLR